MNIKRLTDLDVSGKRVFIRADLNVPQDDSFAITDDTRIRAALPGIQRTRLVQHHWNEVAPAAEQGVEVRADQPAQQGGGFGPVLHRQCLPCERGVHAFFHHGMQQRALALEVIERRPGMHAHRRRNVARRGRVEALAAEESRCGSQQFLASVARVALVQRLARPATGAGWRWRCCRGR